MHLSASDIVGFVAGICTTTSFLPQVIKTMRTRSTRDISLGMWFLLFVGSFLWLVHGIQIDSIPIILANGVTLVLVGIVLFLKVRYK